MDIYLQANYDQILKDTVPLASKVSKILSPFAINIKMPVVQNLDLARYSNTFISLALNLILAGLLYLSSFVIYSIM